VASSLDIHPVVNELAGSADDTQRVQEAIDTCHRGGGGALCFRPGTYRCGTLYLRSGVTLLLEPGSVLQASDQIVHYATDTHHQRYDNEACLDRCFIYAEDAHDIGITGGGVIDGHGDRFPNTGSDQRPMLLRFLRCRHVRLEGITLRRPAAWTTAFIECGDIIARGLQIHSRANLNGDGLDFDSCQNVVVSDCTIDASDDCICLQSSVPGRSCRNVAISNCVMCSRWAGLRIGLLSSGDIEDVVVSNCTMRDMGCSGFKIQSTEGGAIRNMSFSNIVLRNVPRPVFLTLNHFHIGKDAPQTPPRTGRISGLAFRSFRIRNDALPQSPSACFEALVGIGTPGHRIDDIVFDGIDFVAAGGAASGEVQQPEMENVRPEFFVWREHLPAWAVYLRHVEQVEMRNCRFHAITPDARPQAYAEDAVNSTVNGQPAGEQAI
jgi:polygalacturonase